MKYIAHVIVVLGIMFLTSGCGSSESQLEGMNSDVCNNPKCQCPKPCQCGGGCRCGMNGNNADMNTKE